jgi:hypothetical protein
VLALFELFVRIARARDTQHLVETDMARPASVLMLGLLLLDVACGDRVLGGFASVASESDAAAIAPDGPHALCASYAKGSLELPGAAAPAYCEAFASVCGLGRSESGQVFYLTRAECESKYSAASERAQSCSAGRVCEVAAGGSSSLCEGAALACGL